MYDRLLACRAERSTACRPDKVNSLSSGQANSLSYTKAAFERGLIKSHAQSYPYKNDRSNRRIFCIHLIVTNVLVNSTDDRRGSGNRRLAHVGWHTGSKHGLQHEGLTNLLGSQDQKER